MKTRDGIVGSAMKHWHIVFLLIILLIAFGIYALFQMPRQEFPVVTIRQGLVIGVFPGATAAQVEEQLTGKVEKYLFGFKEIRKKKTYSVSKEGMMIIFVELNENVRNADEFWSKLNHGLSLFRNQLPAGVFALFSNSDFGDTSALLISLESDRASYRQLEQWLDKLEGELRTLEPVSKIRRYGLQKEQITVYLEPEKLTSLGINSTTLLASLFTQGLTTTSGTIRNSKMEIPVHISESYSTEKEIAEQIIYSDPLGNIVRLKDVARIVRAYPDPDSYILNNGMKCLLISLEMQDGNNIVQFGSEVNTILEKFKKELPGGYFISRIADQPEVVSDSVATFLKELLFAIAAVILVTMLLLPFRAASVSAASIPITIFISVGLMYMAGLELNTVTLAALIVVLGMIVDNSVVIVDSYMEKLDHGFSRWDASIASAQGFFRAILSATLAISITFFPFLFTLKGTFHDFVEFFPWTVTLTLGISLLVAMLVIPFLQYFFIKKGFHKEASAKKSHKTMLEAIQKSYEFLLGWAFRYKYLTVGTGLISVIAGVILFTQIPQRLMPIADRNQFAVEIYLPKGGSLEETALVCDSLEKLLKTDSLVVSVTSFIGTSSPRFHTTYAPNLPTKNYGQFIVNTASIQSTKAVLDKFSNGYAHYFPNAYVRFKELDYQAVAAPLEVRFSGDNLDELQKSAEKAALMMGRINGISNIRTNFEERLPGIFIDLDASQANRLGINRTTVAANLAMHLDGLPVTTLWEGDRALPVVVKTERNDTLTDTGIENDYIHSVIPGISVPLRQIAVVKPEWSRGQIVHRNGIRTITVLADLDRKASVNEIFPEVKKRMEKIRLPEGIVLSYGGTKESDMETLPRILSGFVLSIIIIFMILLFHFRKISLSLLVLGSSSLTLLGACLGGLIIGVEFGLTSILGVVSVIGIVVRNGIIMLDYAEELRITHGMTVREAAIEAGKRRMRPIFLTSAAASVGVIPMIVSKSALWAPMGTVICFGTILSMVFLVFVLPVVYWLIFRGIDKSSGEKSERRPIAATAGAIMAGLILLLATPALNAQKTYSLADCKNLALENNVGIKNAGLEIEASKQTKKMAFTRFFPKIEATGFSFKAQDPLFDITMKGGNLPVYDGNPSHLFPPTQYAYFPDVTMSYFGKGTIGMISAVQPLFAGGRIITGNALATLGISVSNSRKILSRNEVLLKTEQEYWQLIMLYKKMKAQQLAENLLDTLYKQAGDAWHAGIINRNDVMKVQLKQGDLKISRLQLENGIRMASMALCQTMGIVYDTALVITDTLTVLLPPSSAWVDPAQALENREEYKLLKKSIEAEELQSRMKLGEYLPEVGVGIGSYYTNIMGDQMGNTVAFATAKFPISGWWEASHSIKERKIREEIMSNTSQNAATRLTLQMRQYWFDLTEACKQIEVMVESLMQAEENLRINGDNYKAGIVNISDMLEAQVLLQQTQNRFAEAHSNYNIRLTQYKQATGRYE